MNRIKLILGVLAAACLSAGVASADSHTKAHAGAAVDHNLAAIATVCGCPFAIDVNWQGITPEQTKRQVANSIDAFVGAAQAYCQRGADAKTHFCTQYSSLAVVEDSNGEALDLENTKVVFRHNKKAEIVQTDVLAFFEKGQKTKS
ncbi:MAG: hypothetical protein J0M12_03515 [Deltaproteobacteria bacterium]|nr:hypothetical protein [Deltaproteobacteria bacterium]